MAMRDIEFFKQALEAANTGIWEWNIQNNTLVWTDLVRGIFDLPPEQPITMGLFQNHIHPDDLAMVQRKIEESMNPAFNGNYHVRHRIIGSQHKQVRWVEGFGKVYFDKNKMPASFTGTVVDITDRISLEIERAELLQSEQKARAEAQKEKEKLENLFLKSPIPIAILQGPNFKYVLANQPYRQMVAMDRELLGLTVDDVFPVRDPQAYKILEDVLHTGKRFIATEHRIVMDWYRTGQVIEKFFDVIFEQFPGENLESNLVMIMSVDVTEQVLHRRKSEENETELIQAKASAEEASFAKSRFLANMSHEIRTPLGIILGFTDLALEQSYSPEAVKNYILGIQRNGQMLNRLIGEILDLSKIEASRLELEIVSVPLKDLLEETVSSLQLSAQEKGISLFLKLDPTLPDTVETDPTRLRQILINLIGNAIKFTDRGHVTATAQWLDTGVFQLFVEDTGIGITKEQKEKLFQPFAQADTSMTRRYGGTGLGLILAKELAQALGGDLTLYDSALQIGSVFTCTIKPQSAIWKNRRAGDRCVETDPLHTLRSHGADPLDEDIMNTATQAIMFGKTSDEWETPNAFFNALNEEFAFTTDAACTSRNGKKVRQHIYSALDTDWSEDGSYTAQCVFLNPPYSKVRQFIARAAAEARKGCMVVCLVPSRTDTRWWHEHVWSGNAARQGVEVRFVKGRLKFGGPGKPENSAPFPSVLVIFRPPA